MAAEDDKPFQIKDRRFSAEGESRAEPVTTHDDQESDREVEKPGRPPDLPPLEFSTLILSLASSVVYHLGEMPHPETGRSEQNLPVAKQTIDLLAVLQDKTRGNLTEEEAGLLESLLYELRIKYVQTTR